MLNKLKAAGFKINRGNLEYLGFKITRQYIMPLSDKVQVIKSIVVLTNKTQLKTFIEGE